MYVLHQLNLLLEKKLEDIKTINIKANENKKEHIGFKYISLLNKLLKRLRK